MSLKSSGLVLIHSGTDMYPSHWLPTALVLNPIWPTNDALTSQTAHRKGAYTNPTHIPDPVLRLKSALCSPVTSCCYPRLHAPSAFPITFVPFLPAFMLPSEANAHECLPTISFLSAHFQGGADSFSPSLTPKTEFSQFLSLLSLFTEKAG